MLEVQIETILLSIKTKEYKEDIFKKLRDSNLLDEDEIELLNQYETIYDESSNIPSPGVLATSNPQYAGMPIIESEEDLMQYVNSFLRKKLKFEVSRNLQNEIMSISNGDKPINEIVDKITSEAIRLGVTDEIIEPVKTLADFSKMYEEEDKNVYIKTGLPPIDNISNGIPLGAVIVVMGGTGSFKTMTTTNICYNAMIEGFNVCYISLEIPKYHMFSNLISRHSFSGKFSKPLKSRDIREKNLNEEDRAQLEVITDDIENNINAQFVILDETDFKSYDISGFETKIMQTDNLCYEKTGKGIDVLVLDHAQLLKFSGSKVMDPFAVINYYVSWLRQMSLNFLRQGRKTAVIIVSQASRSGTEYASKHDGQFLITHAAEANEIERSASMMISVFANETSRESNEITVHLLKSRNSETMPEPQQVRINPQYYMVGTGVKVEDGGSPFKEQEIDYSNSIESVLSGETIDLSSIFS